MTEHKKREKSDLSDTNQPSFKETKPCAEPGLDRLYSGSSATGNFSDALDAAIQSAKQLILTDYVSWEITSISGKNGGFANTNIITVIIRAAGPK